MKLFTIPNIITLLNLLCGCLAIVFAFDGNLVWSAYLVGIAAVLDFFDGFAARALKQYSEIGKQLDSLADMVTFGVVPGVVMFQLLRYSLPLPFCTTGADPSSISNYQHLHLFLPYAGFLLTLFSALRLAKFNIDTRQSDSFIGVPTPANAILICSFALILNIQPDHDSMMLDQFSFKSSVLVLISHTWFLIATTLVMSFLLISEIPLFSLKFKSFGWKGNEIRWSFLALCVILLAALQFVGIPLAIVLYIILSIVNTRLIKK